MGHTCLFNHLHIVFSTKHRKRLITDELAERINPYLIGIARQNKFRIIEVGGTEDHIHMLLDLPGTMPISKAVQLLKAGSSKWISETFPNRRFVRVAIGIRRVHDWRIAIADLHPVYPEPARASWQDRFCRGDRKIISCIWSGPAVPAGLS